MFVYHFVDPDLTVETFFEIDRGAENRVVDFGIGNIGTSACLYWIWKKISCKTCLLSYCFLCQQKVAFKSSLYQYFHYSIIEFRIEEKIHTKTVVDVSRDSVG